MSQFRICGYLSESSISDFLGDGSSINLLKFEQLTHLFYQGLGINSATDPTLYDGWFGYGAIPWLPTVVGLAHAKGVKVSIVIGCSDNRFVNIVNTPSLLAQFVTNVKNFINQYSLDGVDMDIEDVSSYGSVHDTLIAALAATLHPLGKLISCAVTPMASGYLSSGFNFTVAGSAGLDMINVMDYDMGDGKWPYVGHAYYGYYVDSFNNWVNAGYPKSKLNMGIPFYGRDYQNAFDTEYSNVLNNISPTDDQNEVLKTTGANAYFNTWTGLDWHDPTAHTTYDPDAFIWDGPNMVRQKAAFAMSNGAGGVMIYDIGEDKFQDSRSLLQNIYLQVSGGGFIHGSVHTASFSVTKTPAGLACQVEIWLGPNATTKAATSGLIPFTSTGSAQAMALPVTMPAAGVYNVYKDVYVNGVLTDFVTDSPITVV